MRVINPKKIREIYQDLSQDLKPKILDPKPDYSYVWVQNNHQLVTNYRNLGYTIATKADIKVDGLKPNEEGHWESGVDILMMAPRATREKIIERGRKLADLQSSGLKSDFHDQAARLGLQSVEVEKDEDGGIKIHKD